MSRRQIDGAAVWRGSRRMENADHTAEFRAYMNGSVEQYTAFAESLAHRFKQFFKFDVIGVQLIEDDHAGQAAFSSLLEHAPGIDFHAIGCRYHHQYVLHGIQCRQSSTDEGRIAGSIQ